MKKDLKIDDVYICIEDNSSDEDIPKEERYDIWIGDTNRSVSIRKGDIKFLVKIRDLLENFIEAQNEIMFLNSLKKANESCDYKCNCCFIKSICEFASGKLGEKPTREQLLNVIDKRIKEIMTK